MTLSFTQRVTIPDDVLVRELDGESVLLNLATDSYFGLDAIGTEMWRALTISDSVQTACDALLAEYDVEPDVLRRDLAELIEKLVAQGLIQLE